MIIYLVMTIASMIMLPLSEIAPGGVYHAFHVTMERKT